MTYTLMQPGAVAAAAADVARMGSVINQARVTAAGQITGVAAAAGDEVSLAVGTLFNRFGLEYQAVITQAGAFHAAFAQALAAAESSYRTAETAAASALTGGTGPIAAMVNAVANDPDITLVAGGSGNPIPGATYITNLVNNYVTPNFPSFTLADAQVMYEPNGAYPIYPVINGIKGLTFDTSVSQGVTILNNTLVAT
ncbi:MAG TPA: PE family protein, partial [Mycobacterium sp.]|nr:PE family protein [Mycobacterium sp.]